MFRITSVHDIMNVFRQRGHCQYGEDVTELQHALQCAEFACQFGESNGIILSCLLHDLGHMLHDLGEDIAGHGVDARHEDLGAELLRDIFPPEIVAPIRLYVAAKRYMCWRDATYADGLSPSSLFSLKLQGGQMSDIEAAEFESEPCYKTAIQVRRYDDMAKVHDMQTAEFESYRELMERFMLPRP